MALLFIILGVILMIGGPAYAFLSWSGGFILVFWFGFLVLLIGLTLLVDKKRKRELN